MTRSRVLVGLLMLALVACNKGGLRPEQVEAWVGRPANDLIKSWGPPTREVQDNGQRVIIYEEMEQDANLPFEKTVSARTAGSAAAAEQANRDARGPARYARAYLFWIDAAGVIARTQIRQH